MEWLIVVMLVIAGFVNPLAWGGAVAFAIINILGSAGEHKAAQMSADNKDGSGLMYLIGIVALIAFVAIFLVMGAADNAGIAQSNYGAWDSIGGQGTGHQTNGAVMQFLDGVTSGAQHEGVWK